MSITFSYPYDPTGTNEACLIKGERWSLSSINNAFRCIIPELAPFFAKDLKVVHITSGKTLRVGEDFYLGHRYKEIEAVASDPIFGSICITNHNLFGEIELEYRTLGGNYVSVKRDVANYLVNLLVDPVTIHWDDLLNKPEFFVPEDHEQSWYDFVNTEALASAIDGVTASVEAYSQSMDTGGVDYIRNRIYQLEYLVDGSGFAQHIINKANPHMVDYTQADALGKDQEAVAALKLYGKTLSELAAYLNEHEVTQAQMDTYLRKTDDKIITQKLILKDGVARIINSGLESIVDLSSGSIKITCKGTAKLLGNADRSTTDESMYLKAGNNVLRVRSQNANLDRDGLTYNNAVVIHLGNLREYLGTVNFGVAHVTTVDTATGNWTGIGTVDDPLMLEAIIPGASDTVTGGVKLVASTNSTSTDTAVVAASLASVVNALTNYVPKTTTINGFPLSADITIDKSYYNLSIVNNTSDLNKPISKAQQDALDLLANKGHKHSADRITLEQATDSTYGVTYLMGDKNDVSVLYAVTPAMLQTVLDRANALDTKFSGLLDRDLVDVIFCNFTGSVTVPTTHQVPAFDENGDPILVNGVQTYVTVDPANWWELTLPATSLYFDQTLFTIPSLTVDVSAAFATYQNTTFYVYVQYNYMTQSAEYQFSATTFIETDMRLFLGTITTDGNTFSSVSLASRVSFGEFRELTDHINDPLAHGYGSQSKTAMGLGLVENYPLSHVGNLFSPKNIVNNWTTIPGSTDSEIALWTVGADQSYVKMPYAGLSASPKSGKYFDAKMWEKIQSDGTSSVAKFEVNNRITNVVSTLNAEDAFAMLELVIGHYYDPVSKVDHFLSLVYSSLTKSGQGPYIKSTLYYDYNRPTQVILGTFDDGLADLNSGLYLASGFGGLPPLGSASQIFHTVKFIDNAGDRSINVRLTSTYPTQDSGSGVLNTWSYTNTTFKQSDMASCPFADQLFNSGSVGFMLRGKADFYLNYQSVTHVQTKKSFASADLLSELVKRGHGVRVIRGTKALTPSATMGSASFQVPVPAGCSRGFKILAFSAVTSSGAITTYYSMVNITSDGDIKALAKFYQDTTVSSSDGSFPTYTMTYIVVGFMDDIKITETI